MWKPPHVWALPVSSLCPRSAWCSVAGGRGSGPGWSPAPASHSGCICNEQRRPDFGRVLWNKDTDGVLSIGRTDSEREVRSAGLTSACPCHTWRCGRPPGGCTAQRTRKACRHPTGGPGRPGARSCRTAWAGRGHPGCSGAAEAVGEGTTWKMDTFRN